MKQVSLSEKDLMMIVECMKFRLDWYNNRIGELENDDNAQSEAVNDACFLDNLIGALEAKLK
ncbi:hypothetical protein [Nevskia soli]|uniref:hypothetical protein n=1 Tax=Nevskia soli TaxID=418856 RepID=UPI0012F9321E|nr:hypothetical protein [Nevskia soli]